MKTLHLLLTLLAWVQLGLTQQSTDGSDLFSAVAQLPECAIQAEVEGCVHKSCTLRQALVTKNITSTLCHVPIRDKSEGIRVSNIVIAVITAACGLTRIFYKTFSSGELGADDYCVLIALFAAAPSVVMIDKGVVPNGIGRDVWTVDPDKITEFAKYLYGLEVLYFLHISLLKYMLLFFFLRIFPKPLTRRLLWGTIVFNTLVGTAFIVASLLQCQPMSFNWTKWDGEHQGHCLNVNALAWANAIISIIMDIWMLALPLFEVFHLQLSWRKKLGVAFMFCVGTFVTVISILRLRSLVTFASSSNPTWDEADVVNWSNLELNIGIMCANLPTIRVILVRLFPKVLGTTKATDRAAYYANGNQSYGMQKDDVALGSKAGKSFGSKKIQNIDAITYTTTYEVRHTDSDELSLVGTELGRFGQQKPTTHSSSTSVSSA